MLIKKNWTYIDFIRVICWKMWILSLKWRFFWLEFQIYWFLKNSTRDKLYKSFSIRKVTFLHFWVEIFHMLLLPKQANWTGPFTQGAFLVEFQFLVQVSSQVIINNGDLFSYGIFAFFRFPSRVNKFGPNVLYMDEHNPFTFGLDSWQRWSQLQ